MNIQDTVNEIIAAITAIPDTAPLGNRAWTLAIKRAFIDLGSKNKYSVCTSGFSDECGIEWLYDLSWYRNDENDHLQEVPLVLECEWARAFIPNVKYDFEKLLLAKSSIKVMIFEVFENNLPQLWEFFETAIRSFRPERGVETYILAAWSEVDEVFYFKTITT